MLIFSSCFIFIELLGIVSSTLISKPKSSHHFHLLQQYCSGNWICMKSGETMYNMVYFGWLFKFPGDWNGSWQTSSFSFTSGTSLSTSNTSVGWNWLFTLNLCYYCLYTTYIVPHILPARWVQLVTRLWPCSVYRVQMFVFCLRLVDQLEHERPSCYEG